MTPERIGRSIYRAELFGEDECAAMVEAALAAPSWQAATVLKGRRRVLVRHARRAESLSIAGSAAKPDDGARFTPYLERIEALVREMDAHHFRFGVEALESASFVRYGRRGHYLWHADARDHGFRKLTALCYLTDAASDGVEGGETSFAPAWLPQPLRRALPPRLRAERMRAWATVQAPRRGSVLVFDSRIVHRAHKVRAGRKISLNVWFR